MKPRFSNQRNRALTRTDLAVIIAALAVLFVLLLPTLVPVRDGRQGVSCKGNLMSISLTCRIWAGNNSDKYPTQVSVTNGGAMELIATGNVAAYFQVMSNELSTPKDLICPQDTKRFCATNFTTDFNNSKISYFVGLNANQTNPKIFLSGDDNFAIDGVPVKSGLLELSTNAPITWTAARHKFAGNIGLADGSVQGTTSSNLNQLLQQSGVATNRLAIP